VLYNQNDTAKDSFRIKTSGGRICYSRSAFAAAGTVLVDRTPPVEYCDFPSGEMHYINSSNR